MNHTKASQSTLADRVLWIRNQHHIVRNSSFGRLTLQKQCELSYFEYTFEYCKPSCEEPLHYTVVVRWRFRPSCQREAPPLFVHPSLTRGFSSTRNEKKISRW
ncbi:uncharacterized protein LOC130961342 [Arachis stenosperma]|uniref:uncharacterized protein LOC130961342 n=1 Tax=Arachis stenosperma TaxID=217475 RepID=UPI0025AC28B4|nr:uncharacterized protein LOC130961342 [Arachis stenosperma]